MTGGCWIEQSDGSLVPGKDGQPVAPPKKKTKKKTSAKAEKEG